MYLPYPSSGQPAGRLRPAAPGLIFILTWLLGLAAVWLLWLPASSAFFRPQGFTQAGSAAQLSSRMESSRARLPRPW